MMRRFASALLLMLAFGTMRATAQSCSFAVTTLNFGTYSGAVLNGTANGKVTCAGAWQILMYAGNGAGATESIRYMTGPKNVGLAYKLFTDSTRTNNWGDTTGNEVTGNGNANVTVYGQITAGQTVPPGTYTDTMTTATTSFSVTVVITATCSISASNLSFGNYAGSLINGSSTLTVTCTNLAPFDVGLNAGTAIGATVTTRKMTGPAGALLQYSMYRDSGHSLNWGNTVGTDTLHSTGTGSATQYIVYGQIPAAQFITTGLYQDTIVATVTY